MQGNNEISLGQVQVKYKGGDSANTFLLLFPTYCLWTYLEMCTVNELNNLPLS